MAKHTSLYWQPFQSTTPLAEDIARDLPVPELQPRWHTIVACAAGFPLGYAVGFGIACLGLLVIGFLIAAYIEDELRFRT
ncbi:hypothetical protein [Lentzea sp. NPDC092896]|uniref:hypothetical protein n=1 Tax=Lentzea sp. NPDC092896 TaxID=3364127 RepID=UPI0037FE6D50